MSQKKEKIIEYSIPKDWEWVRLGEICEILMGQSPPGHKNYRDI